jgi:Uma2 family endonuclease
MVCRGRTIRDSRPSRRAKLLVEVLSPSTEDYDCGDKLAQYQLIPSLQELLLVHHRERKIVAWRRLGAR